MAETYHMMVQPRSNAAVRSPTLTLRVPGVPHGHWYIAVTVESTSSSVMTLITILVPGCSFAQMSLSLVSGITSELALLYITKSYFFLVMYHLWISASSGLHWKRTTDSMASSC